MPSCANGLIFPKGLLITPTFLFAVLFGYLFLNRWEFQRMLVLTLTALLVSLGRCQSGYLVKKSLHFKLKAWTL